MTRYKLLTIVASIAALLTGGSEPTFKLTDDSAMDRLMSSRRVAALQKENPTQLICWIEDTKPGERDLYLGEDHPEHTVRMGTFRVTADGRVWEQDIIDPEAPWVVV